MTDPRTTMPSPVRTFGWPLPAVPTSSAFCCDRNSKSSSGRTALDPVQLLQTGSEVWAEWFTRHKRARGDLIELLKLEHGIVGDRWLHQVLLYRQARGGMTDELVAAAHRFTESYAMSKLIDDIHRLELWARTIESVEKELARRPGALPRLDGHADRLYRLGIADDASALRRHIADLTRHGAQTAASGDHPPAGAEPVGGQSIPRSDAEPAEPGPSGPEHRVPGDSTPESDQSADAPIDRLPSAQVARTIVSLIRELSKKGMTQVLAEPTRARAIIAEVGSRFAEANLPVRRWCHASACGVVPTGSACVPAVFARAVDRVGMPAVQADRNGATADDESSGTGDGSIAAGIFGGRAALFRIVARR